MSESAVERTGSGSWRVLFLLAVAAVTITLALSLRNRSRQPQATVGNLLTSLQLEPLLNGAQPLSLDDVRGKVVMINYWGPWCPPCRIEMPHLVKLAARYRDEDAFRFVSVSCGMGGAYQTFEELEEATAQFVAEHSISFPVHYDPGEQSRLALALSAQLDGFRYPTTVLLDRESRIRGLWPGYLPGWEDDMDEMVREQLSVDGAVNRAAPGSDL